MKQYFKKNVHYKPVPLINIATGKCLNWHKKIPILPIATCPENFYLLIKNIGEVFLCAVNVLLKQNCLHLVFYELFRM